MKIRLLQLFCVIPAINSVFIYFLVFFVYLHIFNSFIICKYFLWRNIPTYTYLPTVCHCRSNNLYCIGNFTIDITIPCQQISETEKTSLKKLHHHSLIKCELKQMDSVQTKYVVKAIALKNHSKIEESSTKEMSIVTRCPCAWSEIFPGVQQKPNTLK